MLRIISANLNGIRSAASKGFFSWLGEQNADFICLQEVKAQLPDLTPEMLNPAGYKGYFHLAEKKGYSGVGLYTRHEPQRIVEGVGVAEFDQEGRYLELIYEKLAVVSLYMPSGSSGEHRQAAKFRFMDFMLGHLDGLAKAGREIALCGDWNIAHKEVDLKNWKGNLKNSGFLPEERAWLTRIFAEQGWVDVYRKLYPDAGEEAYTWWSNRGQARAKNVGWRIDYHIATAGLATAARRAAIYKDRWFSDHAPLTVDYDWKI